MRPRDDRVVLPQARSVGGDCTNDTSAHTQKSHATNTNTKPWSAARVTQLILTQNLYFEPARFLYNPIMVWDHRRESVLQRVMRSSPHMHIQKSDSIKQLCKRLHHTTFRFQFYVNNTQNVVSATDFMRAVHMKTENRKQNITRAHGNIYFEPSQLSRKLLWMLRQQRLVILCRLMRPSVHMYTQKSDATKQL